LDKFIYFLGYQFGYKNLIIITLFISSFILINSLLKNKKIRLIFSFIFGIFISLQLVSLYFTQSFIGYQFFVHFNMRGIVGMYGFFIPHMIFVTIFLIFITFIFYYYAPKIKSFLKINNQITSIIIIFFFWIIMTKGNFVSDTKSLFSTMYPEKGDFEYILEKNGMSDYISPQNIECDKGKNIIVISLESLEKAFLGNKFSSLTPNLQKLKNNWNYFDLEQNNGSSWTTGSLYTYLTGFPAYFGLQFNSIFQNAYHSEISSISHVLQKAGYKSTYLNGNTDFGGTKSLLKTFQFDKIIDFKNVKSNGNKSKYGLRDKDLFELAKKEIENHLYEKTSFALFLSTTDTHAPNGIYDERMESFVSSKNSELEFMVAAVDYMIGDFISFLNKKNILENTVIYIFPDHLKMLDPSMFNDTGDRGLYLITNANKEKLSINSLNELYQIDLPKIILNGAEIKHNLKFFTDYIIGNKNNFIKKNVPFITEINTNGILRINSKPFVPNIASDNYVNYKKDTLRYIAHAGGQIDGLTYTNSKEALDLSYENGFRIFELDIIETQDEKFVAAHDWELWSEMTDFKDKLPPTNEQFLKCKLYKKYTPLDMEGINEWFSIHKDAILLTDKIIDPVKFSKEFIDTNRLMMELFDMTSLKNAIKVGVKSAIPAERLILNMTKQEIIDLKKMGVKHITISRRNIADNIDLLKEFKSNGIMPYAYHVNLDTGFDEEYVTKYEMDYIYGIYADDWEFK